MEKEFSEKLNLSGEIKDLVQFLGRFPELAGVTPEFFQREEYWATVTNSLRQAVERKELTWDEYDYFQGSLVAAKEWLSGHDALTGLPNRRAYQEALEREIANAERYGQPLSLLIIDVDKLKEWNDEDETHQLGDLAIKKTAIKIEESVRINDLVARWGGDEFAVILPHADLKTAIEISQRILNKVKETEPLTPAGKKLAVSIGIREYQNEGPDKFFGKADGAAYQAKKSEQKFVIAED
jgi:diguanylate cyclase (GGDEF)-like protein